MNTLKRDYFGNRKVTKSYPEHHLDFIKTMLSFAIASNTQSPGCKKTSNKSLSCNNKNN